MKEIISLIYNRSGSCLYGCIRFFSSSKKQKLVALNRQSAPFVISQSIGGNEFIVYGSIYELIREIRRLIDDLSNCQERFNSTLNRSGVDTDETPDSSGGKVVISIPEGDTEDRLFFEYIREVTNILLLISSRTRNLFEIFPKFNQECIDELDYGGNKAGNILLKELFDHFVHNRYLFVDGEYVVDIFSDKFSPKSSISKTFMGYKINWREYIDTIRRVIDDVRMKDLTGLLRGRLEKLSPDSSHKDIVFLVQNLESFSQLLDVKIPDERYKFMLDLLFNERLNQEIANKIAALGRGEQVVEETVTFTSPHIKIYEELSERKFTIQARCSLALRHNNKYLFKDQILNDHNVDIGYQEFLDRVNSVFGNDSLLMDFSNKHCT